MANEKEFSPISWGVYGALVRHHRAKLGYQNTAAFSEGILRRTGVLISKDVLYRIEQNRQPPTATQFLAINLSLFDKLAPSEDESDFYSCISKRWQRHLANEDMADDEKLSAFLEEVEKPRNYGISDEGCRFTEECNLTEPIDFYAVSASYSPDRKEITINGNKFIVVCKIQDYYVV